MSNIALLLGIFLVPLAALWLGHNFRDRTPRQRSVFWGLVIGYAVALLTVSAVLVIDPVLWNEAQPVRTVIIFWGLAGFSTLGSLIGLLRPLPANE